MRRDRDRGLSTEEKRSVGSGIDSRTVGAQSEMRIGNRQQ